MPIRPRVMAVWAGVCVLITMTIASTALAHRGSERFRGHDMFRARQAWGVCAQAGVVVSSHVRGFNRHADGDGPGPSSLTETQIKELKAACEKLATAYGAERKADEASSKALWEALKAARAKLDEACPALQEQHERGFWEHTDLSTACEEALKSYWTAAHEAGKTYRTALEEAGKPFDTALNEFEETVKPILTALEAVQMEHHFQPGQGLGGPGAHGYWRG